MSSNPTSFRLPTALTIPSNIEHEGKKIALPSQIRDNIRLLFNGMLDVHQAVVSLNSKQVVAPPATIINNTTTVNNPISPQTGTWFIGDGHLQLQFTATQVPICQHNNELELWRFYIPFQIAIGHISMFFNSFVGSPNIGVGVYDLSGNALVTTLFQPVAVTFYTNGVGPVTIGPGDYWLAQSASDANNTYTFGDNGLRGEMMAMMNSVTTKVGRAANAMSGAGVMPATLGTITPEPFFSGAVQWPPCAALFEV